MAIKDLYQHFKPNEREFVEKIDDLANRVESTYSYLLTEFLNPRQIEISKSVLGHRDLICFISSDYYPTEYARVLIAPNYYEFDVNDFNLVLLEINYNSKFNQLTHSQIMGALLHELGVRRTVFGDILIDDGYAQIFIDRGMLTYCQENISKIGKASVSLRELPPSQLISSKQESQQLDITVSSMRLDRIVAATLKLSRTQAVQLIEADKVKVNYQTYSKSSEILQIGDLISVRGFGRVSLLRDNGFSKNGKFKLSIDKMIHK